MLRFRTANGPEVVFPTPTTGWSFQDPRNSTGRLIPVSQSSEVSKSLWKNRRTRRLSVGSGVAGLSCTDVIVSGALER